MAATALGQHKNDYNSVSFTDVELELGGVVTESHSQHLQWVLHIVGHLCLNLEH